MLSIHAKKGSTTADAGAVADYPDETPKSEASAKPGQGAGVGAVEDYYSQTNGGTPSAWIGAGAEALGMAGKPVDREAMVKLLQGFHPTTGQAMVQQAGPKRRYAYDLTFSAPKSVSIIWAVADRETREAIAAAHDQAVVVALKHIEKRLPLARRGKGGLERESARLVAGVYRHASSREQDPQIHSHCLLLNLAQRADGSWGAIESKEIYRHKMALGAIYRAELAAELLRQGYAIEADNDSFRIGGVSPEAEQEFSRRRQQIEEELENHGVKDARSAALAALATRRKKEIVDAAILAADWRDRAGAIGITTETVSALRQGASPLPYERAPVLSALTQMESTFEERNLWHRTAVAAQVTGMDYALISEEVAALQKDHEVVRLTAETGPRFTTREMQRIERQMVEDALTLHENGSHTVDARIVDATLETFVQAKGFSLSEEQILALRTVTEKSGAVQLVQGRAGAGKTTMLEAARMAWENAGYRVLGAAMAGKAAAGLAKESGIESRTLHSLLYALEPSVDHETGEDLPPREILSARDVLVVDEAGMVGSRQTAKLLDHAKRAGAKVILVGDARQLQAVEAGGAFRALQERLGTVILRENRRQKSQKMRKVVRHALRGEAGKALGILANEGLVSVQDDWREAIAETVTRWAAHYDPARPIESLMLASTKAAVAELNRAARAWLRDHRREDAGEKPVTITVRDRAGNSLGKREIAVGERILFKDNNQRLGVHNGDTGTVIAIGPSDNGPEITIRKDDGRLVTIAPEMNKPEGRAARGKNPGSGYAQIEYGYALTTHATQGMTADHVAVYADGSMASRETTYVQLSRMRHSTSVIFAQPELDEDMAELGVETEALGLDAVKEIVKAMSVARPKDTSLDYEEAAAAGTTWPNSHPSERQRRQGGFLS